MSVKSSCYVFLCFVCYVLWFVFDKVNIIDITSIIVDMIPINNFNQSKETVVAKKVRVYSSFKSLNVHIMSLKHDYIHNSYVFFKTI